MRLAIPSLLLVLLLAQAAQVKSTVQSPKDTGGNEFGSVQDTTVDDPQDNASNESDKSKEDSTEDREQIQDLPKNEDVKLDESNNESTENDKIDKAVKGNKSGPGSVDDAKKPKLDGVIPAGDPESVEEAPAPIEIPVNKKSQEPSVKSKGSLKHEDPLKAKQAHPQDQEHPPQEKEPSLKPEVMEDPALNTEPNQVVGDGLSEVDEDDSSPTLLWFALFSGVTIVSVAIYLHRAGLRSSSLGFSPLPEHSSAESAPLMTPVDRLVSSSLLRLHVPPSAVDKYVHAFQSNRIFRVEQLDEATWERLDLPSAIEIELRERFDKATLKPRSAGLALNKGPLVPTASGDNDDIEFDDWSFDDEETKIDV